MKTLIMLTAATMFSALMASSAFAVKIPPEEPPGC